MRYEKEFEYIIRLLNSHYIKSWKNNKGGCKTDFEKVCHAPERMTDFYEWIDELTEIGCLEFSGQFETCKGKKVDHFVINKDKLFNLLKRNPLYSETYKVFEDKALFGIMDD